jgi:NAD(P)H-dependent flavin oxidoreductase YrpB (nitropropane dioxygenase family)
MDYMGQRGDSNPEQTFMPAGQGMGMIEAVKPAADIMREIIEEADRTLAALGAAG